MQQSLIRVSSLEEKLDNKVINGTTKNNAFSLGVITVRKTMVFLKTLIFCLLIGLIILASLSNIKGKDSKTSNSIANGINMTYLLL